MSIPDRRAWTREILTGLPATPLAVLLFCLALSTLTPSPVLAAERRCGWLDNPTPGNLSLRDAGGEWILSEQGGYEAKGLDHLPPRPSREWIVTNGSSYGYGCVCLLVEVARTARLRQVRRVVSGTMEPLSRCRRDRRLPPMPEALTAP